MVPRSTPLVQKQARRLWTVLLFCALPLLAQRGRGELRLTVTDPAGLGVEASVELVSQANQVQQVFRTDWEGHYAARGLPFGFYRLQVDRPGFTSFSELVEIRSEVPLEYRVTLGLAPMEATEVVRDSPTLLDPYGTGAVYHVGSENLSQRRTSSPGRAVLELVNMQPGWLLEANGVLHPRGSEYDTQYVIDGMPIVDNRSPIFAPGIEVEELQSMKVLTANYPAEYGRKLGGVIEVTTPQDSRAGFHGKAMFEAGTFATQNAYLAGRYVTGRSAVGFSASGGHTDRYLDPPVEENYTNKASTAGITTHLERDFSNKDRLRLYIRRQRSAFLVPNEQLQQEAGQRQDRDTEETMGQVSYQHIFSPHLLGAIRGMVRDLSAQLRSNPLSTPIRADQQRGLRDGYLSGSLSAHFGVHELKVGAETILSSVHEQFEYNITDIQFFDQDLPPRFRFTGKKGGQEHSLYAQDLIRAGRWSFSAGLRWDSYRLLVQDSAFSPRLGAAWYWPSAGLVLRASYDRAFQVPAIENLLLASSQSAQHLTAEATGLPVPPSRGDFYQAGFSKSLSGQLRLDANYFRRNTRNFADDNLLLNTGVSFPIAFSRAKIYGFETKLEMPRWGPVSGLLSYSNLVGAGFLPITGGLFLDKKSADLLHSTDHFAITQDQRNTIRGLVRYQPASKLWMSFGAWYGSGLPVELEGSEIARLRQQFSSRILDQVNFDRGRVRPSYSFDVSLGARVWSRSDKSVRLQADVLNVTNRLNVIDFAGLFSGTALYAPRTFAVRLQTQF